MFTLLANLGMFSRDNRNDGRYTKVSWSLIYYANAMPQLLLDEVLVLIGLCHYKVYASMLMVNKKINKLLKLIDPWIEFIEIREESHRARDDMDSNYTRRMSMLKGTNVGDPRSIGIKHGESALVGWHDEGGKWETKTYYHFGQPYRIEVWAYREPEGSKWKLSESVRNPKGYWTIDTYDEQGNIVHDRRKFNKMELFYGGVCIALGIYMWVNSAKYVKNMVIARVRT